MSWELPKSAKIALNRRREQHQQQKDADGTDLLQRQAANATTRSQYLAGLEAEKAAKQAETDAQIDVTLEPEKIRLRRQWLVDHPGKTESAFEREAWPLIRANLVDKRQQQQYEATLQTARQQLTGELSL